MHALAMLSPIKEDPELSPYRTRFTYARLPGPRTPIGGKTPYHYVQDTVDGPKSPEVSMDDMWIYDCYGSDDTTSPGNYPRTPTTPSHNRTISLPVSTTNYTPPNNAPLIREPHQMRRPSPMDLPYREPPQMLDPDVVMEEDPSDILAYLSGDLPEINTAVFSPAEFREYSPLEQDALSVWEVIDQLTAAALQFERLEDALSMANPHEPLPGMDSDVTFSFILALDMFISDCAEVAAELVQFGEFVQALLNSERDRTLPAVRTLPRASFSERDMKEVLASAAKIPDVEVRQALAALEATPPQEKRRERPPSLKLSTNDAVLLQARLQPRSRLQSINAVGKFSDQEVSSEERASQDDMLRKHRAYVIYPDASPAEDNWSAKSIVDYDHADLPFDDDGNPRQVSPTPVRLRSPSGQGTIPRPLSSPVAFGGNFARGRPPSLALSDPHSPRSSSGHGHSSSSSVSSIFSALPRSSFTTTSTFSPNPSPRLSTFENKAEKGRFPTSSGNFKKMFSNIFKKKEKEKEREKESSAVVSSRRLVKRPQGTGSIDATLTALSLGSPSERDPFAMSPPTSTTLPPPPSISQRSPPPSATEVAMEGYSSMFNPLKAASRFPPEPPYNPQGPHR